MSRYEDLRARLDNREVIILDGAVGTQLQNLGVPIGTTAWSGIAQHQHPDTVRYMHEQYVAAGADIITTNTYSAARHCLEPLGMGDLTRELNLRAVVLAREARDRMAGERSVCIAGSVSNFGIRTGSEPLPPRLETSWSLYDETQCKANLREQASILAESGVDLLLAESTGTTEHRRWVIEACLETGLPVWPGFKAHHDGGGKLCTGHTSDEPFDAGLDALIGVGGDVMCVFHTTLDATSECLPLLQARWDGPIALYPDADRRSDYTSPRSDPSLENRDSPDDFLRFARAWVEQGAQIIGACCGFGFEYIRPLRAGLPSTVRGGAPGAGL